MAANNSTNNNSSLSEDYDDQVYDQDYDDSSDTKGYNYAYSSNKKGSHDSGLVECPLCTEELDETDKLFFPCECGYQVCLWCWHSINEKLNAKCPACRREYKKEAFENIPSAATLTQLKKKKKEKSSSSNSLTKNFSNGSLQTYTGGGPYNNYNNTQPKDIQTNNQINYNFITNNNNTNSSNNSTFPSSNNNNNNISSNNTGSNYIHNAHSNNGYSNNSHVPYNPHHPHPHPHHNPNSSSVRVLQRNLMYVIGLPASQAREEMLKKREMFGKYGKIIKVAINKKIISINPLTPPSQSSLLHVATVVGPNPNPAAGAGALITQGGLTITSSGALYSAYVTYKKASEAAEAIKNVNGITVQGHTLRATYGTTKYCTYFLRSIACNNPNCLYLHEFAKQEDCCTKEDLHILDKLAAGGHTGPLPNFERSSNSPAANTNLNSVISVQQGSQSTLGSSSSGSTSNASSLSSSNVVPSILPAGSGPGAGSSTPSTTNASPSPIAAPVPTPSFPSFKDVLGSSLNSNSQSSNPTPLAISLNSDAFPPLSQSSSISTPIATGNTTPPVVSPAVKSTPASTSGTVSMSLNNNNSNNPISANSNPIPSSIQTSPNTGSTTNLSPAPTISSSTPIKSLTSKVITSTSSTSNSNSTQIPSAPESSFSNSSNMDQKPLAQPQSDSVSSNSGTTNNQGAKAAFTNAIPSLFNHSIHGSNVPNILSPFTPSASDNFNASTNTTFNSDPVNLSFGVGVPGNRPPTSTSNIGLNHFNFGLGSGSLSSTITSHPSPVPSGSSSRVIGSRPPPGFNPPVAPIRQPQYDSFNNTFNNNFYSNNTIPSNSTVNSSNSIITNSSVNPNNNIVDNMNNSGSSSWDFSKFVRDLSISSGGGTISNILPPMPSHSQISNISNGHITGPIQIENLSHIHSHNHIPSNNAQTPGPGPGPGSGPGPGPGLGLGLGGIGLGGLSMGPTIIPSNSNSIASRRHFANLSSNNSLNPQFNNVNNAINTHPNSNSNGLNNGSNLNSGRSRYGFTENETLNNNTGYQFHPHINPSQEYGNGNNHNSTGNVNNSNNNILYPNVNNGSSGDLQSMFRSMFPHANVNFHNSANPNSNPSNPNPSESSTFFNSPPNNNSFGTKNVYNGLTAGSAYQTNNPNENNSFDNTFSNNNSNNNFSNSNGPHKSQLDPQSKNESAAKKNGSLTKSNFSKPSTSDSSLTIQPTTTIVHPSVSPISNTLVSKKKENNNISHRNLLNPKSKQEETEKKQNSLSSAEPSALLLSKKNSNLSSTHFIPSEQKEYQQQNSDSSNITGHLISYIASSTPIKPSSAINDNNKLGTIKGKNKKKSKRLEDKKLFTKSSQSLNPSPNPNTNPTLNQSPQPHPQPQPQDQNYNGALTPSSSHSFIRSLSTQSGNDIRLKNKFDHENEVSSDEEYINDAFSEFLSSKSDNNNSSNNLGYSINKNILYLEAQVAEARKAELLIRNQLIHAAKNILFLNQQSHQIKSFYINEDIMDNNDDNSHGSNSSNITIASTDQDSDNDDMHNLNQIYTSEPDT